jgi:hypothetical protein
MHNDQRLKYIFNVIFKGKKLIKWFQSPLQHKGPEFEPFPLFSFSSMNKMDEMFYP